MFPPTFRIQYLIQKLCKYQHAQTFHKNNKLIQKQNEILQNCQSVMRNLYFLKNTSCTSSVRTKVRDLKLSKVHASILFFCYSIQKFNIIECMLKLGHEYEPIERHFFIYWKLIIFSKSKNDNQIFIYCIIYWHSQVGYSELCCFICEQTGEHWVITTLFNNRHQESGRGTSGEILHTSFVCQKL